VSILRKLTTQLLGVRCIFEIASKESRFWLKLIDTESDEELEKERQFLVNESTELMNIFGAILQKSN
jgi:hypothetical protein